jgi:hypothetical protein
MRRYSIVSSSPTLKTVSVRVGVGETVRVSSGAGVLDSAAGRIAEGMGVEKSVASSMSTAVAEEVFSISTTEQLVDMISPVKTRIKSWSFFIIFDFETYCCSK